MYTVIEVTQAAITLLQHNRLASYFDVSSIVMLVYDHGLTLDLETKLILPAPWNIGKVLYYLTAYLAFVDSALTIYVIRSGETTSILTCTRIFKARTWFLACGMAIAETVLVHRTWTIWGRSRNMAIRFCAAWAAIVAVILFVAHLSLNDIQFARRPTPNSPNCLISQGTGKIVAIDYLLLTITESVILCMTIYVARRNLWGRSSSTLAKTLYRDGILNYIYLFGFSVANIISFFIAPNLTPLSHIHRVLHAILVKRILLNLREAATRDSVIVFSPSRFMTDMAFAHREPQPSTLHDIQEVVEPESLELRCRTT